jgi:tetratricopeptide (TPR) repeat protein
LPRAAELAPIRSGVPRALLLLVLLAGAVWGAYRYLPQWLPRVTSALQGPATVAPNNMAGTVEASARAKLQADRILLEQRLTALDARGAGIWGGADFAAAKGAAAEAAGARDAAAVASAEQHVSQAGQLLDHVEQAAPAALAAELAAGDRALADGQRGLALQAFELALRIAPQDERALAGQARARALAEQPTAAPAHAAAAPATQTPAPAVVAAGSEGTFGQDRYAKAAGEGFAALGAGHLEEARAAFERARALRPSGSEAVDGLKRVDAAQHAHGFGTQRTRAEDAEADERWDDALSTYSTILRADPAQEFAQQGRDRARSRLQLHDDLQALVDRPDLLAAPEARVQAATLLQNAQQINSPGPVLRLQMARLSALLPEFERPVRLTLVSDGLTQVSVPGVGTFGGFTHREVDLKPGHYTVVGTREGYREVRRDVSLNPGQTQTINVSCYDPL